MKKDGIINPALCAAVAAIGHTDSLVIADPGLPIPDGVEVIDLSLVRGKPSFCDVLEAVAEEFVIESYILASEMEERSGALYGQVTGLLAGLPFETMPHEELKNRSCRAKALVRTGETTSFANVILIAGVNF